MKNINFKELGSKAKEKAVSAGSTVKDFVGDHEAGIMYTILYGGLTIYFGQLIHYMHMLNKNAKTGVFMWNPLQRQSETA